MAFSVTELKTALASGGARPTLFAITGGEIAAKDEYMIRSGQLPGHNINVIPINWRGRATKLAGYRTYDPWTITILNDDGDLRKTIVNRMEKLSGKREGSRSTGYGDHNNTNYKTYTITQLHKDGSKGNTYSLVNAFPISVGDLALDWSTEGFQEYTITFRYDYFTEKTSPSGNTVIASV
tara:strand:+ start:2622 stop:3161 length:540 start_codon:yes stop_codon:yes gene_type:complete